MKKLLALIVCLTLALTSVAAFAEDAAPSELTVAIGSQFTTLDPALNTEVVNNICLPAGIPVIAGEEGICAGCGVATLSISYYDIGYATGLMAYEILANGADVSAMPIQYAPQFVKEYNAEICEALGITVPEDYQPIE